MENGQDGLAFPQDSEDGHCRRTQSRLMSEGTIDPAEVAKGLNNGQAPSAEMIAEVEPAAAHAGMLVTKVAPPRS